MKQDIIKEGLKVLHQHKIEAEQQYNNKMQPLYQDENFKKLNSAYTKTLIENARIESVGEKPDKTAENKLKNEIEKLISDKNLSDAKVEYNCNFCNDEGYVNGQMCSCLKKEISKILLKNSGFEKLESFSEATKTSGDLEKYYNKMQEWCNSKFTKNLIYLAGPTGVGKTYLIRCMANELIQKGKIIKIVTAFKMNQDFKLFSKTFDDEILNKYLDCEVLFIDDLGTEPIYKNVTVEYLYLIINERKMKKLPTVITTNLDLNDLRNRYDERIFSRIVDRQTSITLLLAGNDKRLK